MQYLDAVKWLIKFWFFVLVCLFVRWLICYCLPVGVCNSLFFLSFNLDHDNDDVVVDLLMMHMKRVPVIACCIPYWFVFCVFLQMCHPLNSHSSVLFSRANNRVRVHSFVYVLGEKFHRKFHQSFFANLFSTSVLYVMHTSHLNRWWERKTSSAFYHFVWVNLQNIFWSRQPLVQELV